MNVYDFKTITQATGCVGANNVTEAGELITRQYPGAVITSITLRSEATPDTPKKVIEYEYYKNCSNRPSKLPEGCECETGVDKWEVENAQPSEWGWLTRRWPKPQPKVEAKPKAGYTLKGDTAIIIDYAGKTHACILPYGWYVVTGGVRQTGDMYWSTTAEGHWRTVDMSVGQLVSTFTFPTLRKISAPAVPTGWYVVTEGVRIEGDMFWAPTQPGWEKCDYSVGSAISAAPLEIVIRKKPVNIATITVNGNPVYVEIPEGWHRVTEGKVEAGDKSWRSGYYGPTRGFHNAEGRKIGDNVGPFYCVIRKNKDVCTWTLSKGYVICPHDNSTRTGEFKFCPVCGKPIEIVA